jgi:hypothetical protein
MSGPFFIGFHAMGCAGNEMTKGLVSVRRGCLRLFMAPHRFLLIVRIVLGCAFAG